MKQWIILIIAVTLIVWAGFFEICYLQKTSRYLLSDVDYSKQALNSNNIDLAKSHFDALESTWKNLKQIWSIYVDHDEIEDMDKSILEYKLYLQKEDEDEAYLSLCEVERKIYHIVEKQEVHIGNVF